MNKKIKILDTMNQPQAISILFFFFFIILDCFYAQSPPPPPPMYTAKDLFKPSLAMITVVFSIVFTLTLVLLIYAKCFHNDHLQPELDGDRERDRLERLWQGLFNRSSRFSGLNKTTIDSLPFFRFSALKGSKQGLECSVCLSKFEDVEILRLLPKCRHAFHIGCIDQWLEQHATCPFCRNRVSLEENDLSVWGFSNDSIRFMTRGEDSSLEVYIEREDGSSRFSSFRKILKKSLWLDPQGNEEKKEKHMHKFNHRIVFSEAVFKNRWSNVTSSDLTFWTLEMLNSPTDRGQRGTLRGKEDIEMKRMLKNKDSSRRAVSEITTVSRENAVGGSYSGLAADTASTSQNRVVGARTDDERRRQLWLPIARRTAQWFVNREQMSELNTTRQSLNV